MRAIWKNESTVDSVAAADKLSGTGSILVWSSGDRFRLDTCEIKRKPQSSELGVAIQSYLAHGISRAIAMAHPPSKEVILALSSPSATLVLDLPSGIPGAARLLLRLTAAAVLPLLTFDQQDYGPTRLRLCLCIVACAQMCLGLFAPLCAATITAIEAVTISAHQRTQSSFAWLWIPVSVSVGVLGSGAVSIDALLLAARSSALPWTTVGEYSWFTERLAGSTGLVVLSITEATNTRKG